jgi:hypothetical protein
MQLEFRTEDEHSGGMDSSHSGDYGEVESVGQGPTDRSSRQQKSVRQLKEQQKSKRSIGQNVEQILSSHR